MLPGPGGASQPTLTEADGTTVKIRWQDASIGQQLDGLINRSVKLEGAFATVQESALPGLPARR